MTCAAPLVLDYPFTVGLIAKLTAVGSVSRVLWGLTDTGTADNYLLIRMPNTEAPAVVAAAGGTDNSTTAAGTMTAGAWMFILGRFVSSTERKINTYSFSNGAIATGVTTTARAPTGMDTITLGALSTSGGISLPWDGAIAEYWLANADVGSPGVSIPNQDVHALALKGPFAFSHIVKNLVEYRSFRKSLLSTSDDPSETYYGGWGRHTWTETNGVTISPHPPLPYYYRKPRQIIRGPVPF